jgi:hypothetical protein
VSLDRKALVWTFVGAFGSLFVLCGYYGWRMVAEDDLGWVVPLVLFGPLAFLVGGLVGAISFFAVHWRRL